MVKAKIIQVQITDDGLNLMVETDLIVEEGYAPERFTIAIMRQHYSAWKEDNPTKTFNDYLLMRIQERYNAIRKGVIVAKGLILKEFTW